MDCIEVEELWKNSGATSYGYNDPIDVAFEMVEYAVNVFLEKLKEYKSLAMQNEEKLYCMGILKGLYKFDKESNSSFREWAEDVANTVFQNIYDDWQNGCKDENISNDMKQFIQDNCGDWGFGK